jgi:N-acetylglucosaminyldiphosphoundecaprenol N-acetyl-beta-D-mannosaminyltransferase
MAAPTLSQKRNVLGVLVDAVDLDGATDIVVDAALEQRPMSVAAFAVHPVMMAARDPKLRAQVNRIDLVGADGQPVRWALNLLHGARLRERVYGPELMRRLCAEAERERLPIYLYGSWPETVEALRVALARDFPDLVVAGGEPGRFVDLDHAAQEELAARIRTAGARLVFVGLGCPRQEQFVWAMRDRVGVPLVAVGAAFDYNAGLRPEAPRWMMRTGLQWVQRLAAEPRRLWRRYIVLNPLYLLGLCAQLARVWRPRVELPEPPRADVPG